MLAVYRMNQGFTLLVIIGLRAGSILVGKELIKNTELRATIQQIEQYRTAAHAFKGKYNCFPGDCREAINYGLGVAGGPGDNGDGNGIILGGDPATGVKESMNFWYHLSQAGTIQGNFPGFLNSTTYTEIIAGKDVPKTKLHITSGFWISTPYALIDEAGNYSFYPLINYFWLFGTIPEVVDNGTFVNNTGATSPYEMYVIDKKIDDGLPMTGSINLSLPSFSDFLVIKTTGDLGVLIYGAGGENSPYCASTDVNPPIYNTANVSNNPNTLCVMAIKAIF